MIKLFPIRKSVVTRSALAAACATIASLPSMTSAAISYDTIDSTYTQGFDGGPGAAATLAWTDDSTFSGWYARRSGGSSLSAGAPTDYRRTNGSSTGIDLYLWRFDANAGDYALGTKPLDAGGSMQLGVQFVNNTTETLTQFTVGYSGEQWYATTDGNNSSVFSYQLGATGLGSGTWTTVDALEFNSLQEGAAVVTNTAIDGNAAANRTVLSPATVTGIEWLPGTSLWVRWFDANSTGADQGLAVDDFTFSAGITVPEPSALSLSALGVIGLLRRRTTR